MAAAPVNEMMSVMLAPLMDQLTQGRITAAQYSDLSRSIISQAQPPKNKPLSNVTAPREPAIDKDSAQQREAAPTTSPGGSNLPPSDADLDTSQESICNSQESICTSPEDDASIGLAMDDIHDVDAEESPLKRARANDQPAGQHASEGPAHQPAKPTDAAQIESELKEQREMVFGGFKLKLPVARDKKTRKRPLNKPPAARGRGPSHKKNGSRATDVSNATLRHRPCEYPGEGFEVRSGQLYCGKCCHNIGSGKSACDTHIATDAHKKAQAARALENEKKQELMDALDKDAKEVAAQNGGATVTGTVNIDKETQAFRAETTDRRVYYRRCLHQQDQ